MSSMTIEKFVKHRRVVQFLEYLVGGGLFFITGYSVFAILYSGFGWTWWHAKIVGDIAGFSLNYIVQRYWAFNNKQLYKDEGTNRLRYIVVTICNVALDIGIIAGLHALGVSPYIGMIVAALFFTGWNYVCYRFWVFRKESKIGLT